MYINVRKSQIGNSSSTLLPYIRSTKSIDYSRDQKWSKIKLEIVGSDFPTIARDSRNKSTISEIKPSHAPIKVDDYKADYR